MLQVKVNPISYTNFCFSIPGPHNILFYQKSEIWSRLFVKCKTHCGMCAAMQIGADVLGAEGVSLQLLEEAAS